MAETTKAELSPWPKCLISEIIFGKGNRNATKRHTPYCRNKKHIQYDPKFILKTLEDSRSHDITTVALTNVMMWDIRRHHKELDTYFEPKDKAKKNT
ncbi:Hypothetical predicted protein [Mytilus galloprovincialis]|uniref:Uncharacterized protein n=1 Tax=Mytilus galloprovincialis TaxID=29158 RepID=A0A8B6GVH8_MYTGA|nr:Hypothetical predicted protein [Mytilus galloprovincialis]